MGGMQDKEKEKNGNNSIPFAIDKLGYGNEFTITAIN